MKKLFFVIFLIVLGGVGYYFSVLKLDEKKVVLVLPSSGLASSPFFYKKDGDFFLAQDLRDGLVKKGYAVEYRFREDYNDLKLGRAKNVVYFKGYYNFEHLPKDDNKNRNYVLYVYYVEGLNPSIFKEVDVIACASKKMSLLIKENYGFNAQYVSQFTNPERFSTAFKDDDKASQVLFVGSNHSRNGRKSVNYALEMNALLTVYGKFWENMISYPILKGSYIDNDELYKYYASADIVLNDHRADMEQLGFVSNRIYDVTATGGFILTDYLSEIEEAYGDSIATYKNFEEFGEKLKYYLSHPEERLAMAKRAQAITLEKFTNLKAAEKFIEIFKNIKK